VDWDQIPLLLNGVLTSRQIRAEKNVDRTPPTRPGKVSNTRVGREGKFLPGLSVDKEKQSKNRELLNIQRREIQKEVDGRTQV